MQARMLVIVWNPGALNLVDVADITDVFDAFGIYRHPHAAG